MFDPLSLLFSCLTRQTDRRLIGPPASIVGRAAARYRPSQVLSSIPAVHERAHAGAHKDAGLNAIWGQDNNLDFPGPMGEPAPNDWLIYPVA